MDIFKALKEHHDEMRGIMDSVQSKEDFHAVHVHLYVHHQLEEQIALSAILDKEIGRAHV